MAPCGPRSSTRTPRSVRRSAPAGHRAAAPRRRTARRHRQDQPRGVQEGPRRSAREAGARQAGAVLRRAREGARHGPALPRLAAAAEGPPGTLEPALLGGRQQGGERDLRAGQRRQDQDPLRHRGLRPRLPGVGLLRRRRQDAAGFVPGAHPPVVRPVHARAEEPARRLERARRRRTRPATGSTCRSGGCRRRSARSSRSCSSATSSASPWPPTRPPTSRARRG